jgi:membrane protease YdiL (CAAX protease family)
MPRFRSLTTIAGQVGLAGLAGFLVAAGGSFSWGALLVANLKTSPTIPWSVPAMAVVLWLLWRYLGGRWRPTRTAATRRALLRSRLVPASAFGWAIVAGLLALVALAGLWIVLVELTGVGGNPTLSAFSAYPPLVVALGIAMGSLVSPLTEEAAFRGYSQVLLERRLPALLAVAFSSFFFALWHGPTQGFSWSKLVFFFLVGVVFGTIAYLTNSVLPAIPVHIEGDVTFFTLIWPRDYARPLVWQHGPDPWFWAHAGQVILFGALAALAFRQLARLRIRDRAQVAVRPGSTGRVVPGVAPRRLDLDEADDRPAQQGVDDQGHQR